MAERSGGKSLGLALGMGGARGWCHIGVLRELAEMGIAVDRVAGASMGALIGAAWAAGKLDEIEDWARSLTYTKFLGYIDPRMSGGGLIGGAEIAGLLDRWDIPENIEDMPFRFAALATDMRTGREVWFDRGSVRTAVRASVSIPGIFNPVRVEDMWLIDGGLIDPVPVMGVRAMGFGPVLGIDPNGFGIGEYWTPPEPVPTFTDTLMDHLRAGSALLGLAHWLAPKPGSDPMSPTNERPPNVLQVMSVSIDIMTGIAMRARLAAAPPDILVQAPLNHLGILEFYRAEEAIEAGRQAIRDRAEEILTLVS